MGDTAPMPSTDRGLDDDARATLSGAAIGFVVGFVLTLNPWAGLAMVLLEVTWLVWTARDPSQRAYCRRLGITALIVAAVASVSWWGGALLSVVFA